MIVSYEAQMDWYCVSSEGVSHSKVVRGPRPDEIFDKSAPPQAYHVYQSRSRGNKWVCPCNSFMYSNYKRNCKHIEAVIKYREEIQNSGKKSLKLTDTL